MKKRDIELTWFKDIVELNKFIEDGEQLEIISLHYDLDKDIHWLYYRLIF